MTTRIKLPNRRLHDSFEFEHFGSKYTAGIGFFPDGRIAELFLNSDKINSSLDVNARDAAVAVSLALQYQCPVETLLHSMSHEPNGRLSSPVGRALQLALKASR